jgi:hypothetical protein
MKKIVLGSVMMLSVLAANAQTDTSKVTKSMSAPVHVPNTSVTITPPLYFKASTTFNGFIHDGAGATIQISETEGKPYPYMAQAMANEENLKKQGITLISQEKVTIISGKQAIMLVIGFEVKGPKQTFNYERIVFLTGDYNKTIIINMNYPVAAKDILFQVLKQSLLTVNY